MEIHDMAQKLESKRTYVRYVSHEIRTPLNIALLGLSYLTDLISNKDVGAHTGNQFCTTQCLPVIQDIEVACNEAVDVLNDLLTYDKLESDTLVLDRSDVSVVALVEEVVRAFRVQVRM